MPVHKLVSLGFRHWSIGRQLGAGFGVVLLGAVIALVISIWSLKQVAQATQTMMAEPLAKERLVQEWSRNIGMAVRRTAAMAMSDEAQLAAYFTAEQKASAERSAELQKKIEALVKDDAAERVLYEQIQDQRKTYLKARDSVLAARKSGDSAAAQQLFEKDFSPRVGPYLAAVDALVSHQRDSIDKTAVAIQAQYRQSLATVITLALVLLGVGSLAAWRIARSISVPLHEAVKAAERVARGQLDMDVSQGAAGSANEVTQLQTALGAMVVSLTQLVSSIRESAESIAVASGQIAQGNLDLSLRTEKQASSLQETSASMHELTDVVSRNTAELQSAGQLAGTASQAAAAGGQVIEVVNQSMQGIEAGARKIGQITSVIDGIAFQTNILALNAAVEAARAGEQGRGFAVVAAEVRTLAQRAAESAKEIRSLIGRSVEDVEQGAARVVEAQGTMRQIVDIVNSLAHVTQTVAQSSDGQRRGIEEVNSAVQQIDGITQQNAALVEQASAAAASLSEQTSRLESEVRRFVLR